MGLDQHILNACRKNFAYDAQCEDSRAEYLYEIIQLAQSPSRIQAQVLISLLRTQKDSWDASQLMELAKVFAQNGNLEARAAMYRRLAMSYSGKFEFIQADTVIKLDGVNGLVFVADLLGKAGDPTGDWYLEMCEREFPLAKPREVLENLSRSNLNIRKYLKMAHQSQNAMNRPSPPKYQNICEAIERNRPIPFLAGSRMEKHDLMQLGKDLVCEENCEKIKMYLRVFSHAKHLPTVETFLRFMHHKNVEIRAGAVGCLRHYRDSRVREIIDKNYSTTGAVKYLKLFIKNFEERDNALLLDLLRKAVNCHVFHCRGQEILEIYRSNPTKGSQSALLEIYRRTNCAICRGDCVQLMLKLKALPRWVARECKYDCDFDTRLMVKVK